MELTVTTNETPLTVHSALVAAYPGEGFSSKPGASGQVIAICDNVARVTGDVTSAISAWNAAGLARAKVAKLQALADRRYRAQILCSFGGGQAASDDTAAARISAAIGALEDAGQTGPVNWKFADGSWVPLSLSNLKLLRGAGVTHVQACFDMEAALAAEIGAATTTVDVNAIDIDSGWPT